MFLVTVSLLVFEILYTNYVILIECLNKLYFILGQNSVLLFTFLKHFFKVSLFPNADVYPMYIVISQIAK